MKEYTAIGLMSGSSLDGIDLALVHFTIDGESINYHILATETMPYPELWQRQLSDAFLSNPEALEPLDHAYGCYLGQCVTSFIERVDAHPDFVASHGHTIFHRPEQGITLQIGDGQAIADRCRIITINDFRSEDVSKGGQGAPLVPIGDKLLFHDYEICLNIGGIANLSYETNGNRIAYDVCIANQALNHLAQRVGLAYDKDGNLAREGKVNPVLLDRLNDNVFFQQAPPKSLGREFFEMHQRALLDGYEVADALATMTEHIAFQISRAVEPLSKGKMLVTGGGAHNRYLIERIQHHTKHQVVLPDDRTIDYKEALIFALLGLLKMEGKTNVLRSVTGASSDSCSGRVWTPNPCHSNILV